MWRYEVIALEDAKQYPGSIPQDKLRSGLNDLGKKGWELVAAVDWEGDTQLIFKQRTG
jgi:hypothetical protein